MIRAYVIKNGKVLKDVPVLELKKYLRDKKNVVWVDMETPTDEEYKLVLEDTFSFHPLSIEDCKTPLDLPKVDVFEEYLFFVFHSLAKESEKGYFKKREIDFFLGINFLVSVHVHNSRSADNLAKKMDTSKIVKKTADFLMYEFIDYLVDLYFPLLDTWDDYIENIESKIIVSTPPKNIVNRMVSIKREILSARKSIIPQRDVISKMVRIDIPFVRPKTKVYFKDVYDHIMLVYTELEIQRDILNSAFEAYVSLVSNQTNVISMKMNEIMQKLTVIATIFMPLTFVASVYGMNFKYIPLAEWRYGFEATIVVCVILGVILYFYFKKKKWME